MVLIRKLFKNWFLREKSFFRGHSYVYKMYKENFIDIDECIDLKLANFYLKEYLHD